MWDIKLLAAIQAIEKSMAYVLYRLMLCLGVALGYLFATLAGAGTLVGFASLSRNASSLGPIGAVVGFALFAYLMYKLRPVWLSAVNMPQLALLADQEQGVSLPTGKAQIDYAKQRKAERFPSTAQLFELDEAIRQVQGDLAALHPCPQLPTDQPALKTYAIKAAGWLSAQNHQTLLAWHCFKGTDQPWQTAAAGLAVQDQHFASLLKNRLAATVFAWLGFLAFYPPLVAGIEMLIDGIPINMSFWPYVFAGVFAWAIKAAFFDAIAEAAMMTYFFPLASETVVLAPSAALQTHSAAYRQMLDRSES